MNPFSIVKVYEVLGLHGVTFPVENMTECPIPVINIAGVTSDESNLSTYNSYYCGKIAFFSSSPAKFHRTRFTM